MGLRFKSTIPDGRYWLNAALGDVPVPATPYQVAITPKGAQLSYGFKRRRATSEAQLDPFGVDWFVQPVSDGGDARPSLLRPHRGSRKWRPRRAVFSWLLGMRCTATQIGHRTRPRKTFCFRCDGGLRWRGVVEQGFSIVAVELDKGRSVVLAPAARAAVKPAASRVWR